MLRCKFWLAAAIVFVGPLMYLRVWEDNSLIDVIGIIAMWGMMCAPGIIVGYRRFQQEIRHCISSSEMSIGRRLASGCSALKQGICWGLVSGFVALFTVCNLEPSKDSASYGVISVPLFFAMVASVIAFIFGCGLGQPLKQS